MERNNPLSDIVLITNDVLDSLPDLSIIACKITPYGHDILIGDDGIGYRIDYHDSISPERINSLIPYKRWIDWRTGPAFLEERKRNRSSITPCFSPWFSFEGWVCLYSGLGHWIVIRKDYWPAFEREVSGIPYRDIYPSFPILAKKIIPRRNKRPI